MATDLPVYSRWGAEVHSGGSCFHRRLMPFGTGGAGATDSSVWIKGQLLGQAPSRFTISSDDLSCCWGSSLACVVFFLHESRRYVCRFCTSHLSRVKRELLLSRLHSNKEAKQENPHAATRKPKNHDPQKNTKPRKQPVTQLLWSCRDRE